MVLVLTSFKTSSKLNKMKENLPKICFSLVVLALCFILFVSVAKAAGEATASATPTATTTATPTTAVATDGSLPTTGVPWPTMTLLGMGVFLFGAAVVTGRFA